MCEYCKGEDTKTINKSEIKRKWCNMYECWCDELKNYNGEILGCDLNSDYDCNDCSECEKI